MADTVAVDAEFETFLDPLTPDEFDALKAKIKAEGCRSTVVVWKEQKVVVDGHNTLKICRQLRTEPRFAYQSFPDRDAVKRWMIDNQLARRNLSPERASYYRGMKFLQEKQERGGPRKGESDSGSSPNCHGGSLGQDTASRVAAETHVSPRTIARDAEFADAVNAHEAAAPGAKAELLSGQSGMTRAEVVKSAPMLCDRCKRVGVVKNCPNCALLAQSKEKKAKPHDASPYPHDDGVPDLPGVYRPLFQRTAEGHEVALDAHKNPAPDRVGDVFADPLLRSILADAVLCSESFEAVTKRLNKVTRGGHFPFADIPKMEKWTKTLRDTMVLFADHLREAVPHLVCPGCSGAPKGCKVCRMTGYISKGIYDLHPEYQKRKRA